MPRARISGFGELGINSDLPPWSIRDNAISFGKNVRAFHGRLTNFPGHEVYTTAPIEPHDLYAFEAPDRTVLWLEAGLNKVYVYDGSVHTNITRQQAAADVDYTTDEYFDRWTGGIQGKIGFLNNGNDGPQQWDNISIGTKLRDMVYDPQGAPGSQTWDELQYKAYAMRPYAGTIVAMNISEGINRFPSTLRWCEFIAPGDTDTDWVPRTTNNANFKVLGDTSGNIIDGAPLRDDFIIYKQDSSFRMSFTGGDPPFIFERLPEHTRVINRRCIGITDEFHVLMSRGNIEIFDGNQYRSILERKYKVQYRNELFPNRILSSFVVVNAGEDEVWCCYPTQDQPGTQKWCDRAIVWNYANDTVSITDLPNVKTMDSGIIIPELSDNFDDPPDITFDEDTQPFDSTVFQQVLEFPVGAYGTNVAAFTEVTTDNGTPRECIAERTGLILVDPETGIRSTDAKHMLRSIRPDVETTQPFFIQVGAQETTASPIMWETEQSFDPLTQDELKFRATGKYFAFRIRTNTAMVWALTELEFEYLRRISR